MSARESPYFAMSNAIWDADLAGMERAVALTILRVCPWRWGAPCSVPLVILALKLGFNVKTVRRAFYRLVKSGAVELLKKSDGGGRAQTHIYTLSEAGLARMRAADSLPQREGVAPSHPPSEGGCGSASPSPGPGLTLPQSPSHPPSEGGAIQLSKKTPKAAPPPASPVARRSGQRQERPTPSSGPPEKDRAAAIAWCLAHPSMANELAAAVTATNRATIPNWNEQNHWNPDHRTASRWMVEAVLSHPKYIC